VAAEGLEVVAVVGTADVPLRAAMLERASERGRAGRRLREIGSNRKRLNGEEAAVESSDCCSLFAWKKKRCNIYIIVVLGLLVEWGPLVELDKIGGCNKSGCIG